MSRTHSGEPDFLFVVIGLAWSLLVLTVTFVIRFVRALWAGFKAFMGWTKKRMVPHVSLGPVKLTDYDRVRHCHIVGLDPRRAIAAAYCPTTVSASPSAATLPPSSHSARSPSARTSASACETKIIVTPADRSSCTRRIHRCRNHASPTASAS